VRVNARTPDDGPRDETFQDGVQQRQAGRGIVMCEVATRGSRRGLVLAAGLAAGLLVAGGAGAWYFCHASYRPGTDEQAAPPGPEEPVGDLATQVHQFCGACHTYPPPDTFPKRAWPFEVEQGYKFFAQAGISLHAPPRDRVVEYFQQQAPEALPSAKFETAATPVPVHFERTSFPVPPGAAPVAISNVNLVHLFDDRRLDVLACDMYWGEVMVLSPYAKSPAWNVVYRTWADKGFNPAHAEVVDLDGDGIKDILVANLGSFAPTDRLSGSVVWLRGKPDGTFTPITLLENVGRVADVQAADFRGTGKLDLVVAVFGWQRTGEIKFLENQTTDWAHPRFEPHTLDKRHGGIHVPVADLNSDGRPDFVALISQEHETVVAFLNEGGGRFREESIYKAPHPAYGSTGIQLVDMDGDGQLDVLYTNGDVLDQPYLLKPYHSVQWLKNPGTGRFPWENHPITPMYGVHRAVAADFTGSGKKDIIAAGFLDADAFPQREKMNLDSIIYLEQGAPGKFARHSLESATCDHVTCAAGDIYGTGRVDMVTGNFTTGGGHAEQTITIWKNVGTVGKQ
jgi:hypothetical protein